MNRFDYLHLISRILTLDVFPERTKEIRERLAGSELSWEKLVSTASEHLVLQCLYSRLNKQEISDRVPEDILEYLEHIHHLNSERNNRIIEQAGALSKLFNDAGISHVYLKGAGNLLDGLYDDSGDRIMSDIDILIPKGELAKAVDLLVAAAYQETKHKWGNPSEDFHHPTLFHKDYVAPVELHFKAVKPPWDKHLPEEIIIKERKETVNPAGSFVLSDRHQVLMNFIHSQLSNKAAVSGLLQLRDVYDLWRISLRCGLQNEEFSYSFRNRMPAYMNAASRLFGDPEHLPESGNIRSRLYYYHFRKNYSSGLYYRIFHYSWKGADLLFNRYLLSLPRMLFRRKSRRNILKKLRDRNWYSTHLEGIRKDFR